MPTERAYVPAMSAPPPAALMTTDELLRTQTPCCSRHNECSYTSTSSRQWS